MARAIDKNQHFEFKKNLAARFREKNTEIQKWFQYHAEKAPTPFYSSVDLRDSGYKIAPVDSNLYPAGFNNICPEDLRTAPPIFRDKIIKMGTKLNLPEVKKILILPEFHTTNRFYLENLYFLTQLLTQAGFDIALGWLADPQPTESFKLMTASEKSIEFRPIEISKDGVLSASGFVPDVIILNNDFSGGYPKFLDPVKQPIVPSHHLGWHTRKKSEHFVHYNRLVEEFAKLVDIDPFVFKIETKEIDQVNFNDEVGIDRVAKSVEETLENLKKSYEAHQIKNKPFVFIKNNAGTYGMGIMVAHDVKDVLEMNRRTKNKMSVGKNKSAIASVVVQEGIPTATLVDRLAAEPVIYLVGCELIGGFLRTNSEKSSEENLNSPGMVFKMLCMTDLRDEDEETSSTEESTLEMVYGTIARISALATGYELQAH